jgi:Na+/H+ antiporter NhaA
MTTEAAPAPYSARTAWARNVAAPVRDFLTTETGSAAVLLGATIAALVWANWPGSTSYESVWTTDLSIRIGSSSISLDLREWVSEGLMVFFFLIIGLEARREFDMGELRERKRIAIPVVAAVGGMAVPIAIYLAFNAGGRGSDGWGTAMSTDTAFLLGVLALVGPRYPQRLRVFMLTLAVFDDLCALLVIAFAYTSHVDFMALMVALVVFLIVVVLLRLQIWRTPLYVVLGAGLWVAMYESGIHPTIAGLAVGLATSAFPPARSDLERVIDLARSFREQPSAELARSASLGVESAISPNERLQLRLHPWTSYVIVPLFALANAGIHVNSNLISDAVSSPITLGIVIGYVVGKPVGIVGASWIATRVPGRPRLPIGWPRLFGGGTAAGIGFTVSLLIAGLAFSGQELEEAKVGILASALLATVLTWIIFRIVERLPESVRARQLSRLAGDIIDLTRDVDPERDHVRGAMDAPVTLVEYGDYQCPYCGRAEPIIRELLSDFGDDLRYVFRHLPLSDVHANAQMAAEASEAAAAQGEFWAMYDVLMAHPDALRPGDLRRYADELGLDVERFWEELRTRDYAPRVAEDVSSADASGVSGTPTFFINGRRHQGAYDADTLKTAVRFARARAAARQAG